MNVRMTPQREQSAWKHTVRVRANKYGTTIPEMNAMLESSIACEICDTLFDHYDQKHVEHDHTTGTIRGIVCTSCNNRVKVIDQGGAYRESQLMGKAKAFVGGVL